MTRPSPRIAIDHVGLVVADIGRAVTWFRAIGFQVSDPVPLMGAAGPVGQDSAHVVFENGYLEISAPVDGCGNHLEPYLARGEGVRILCLRSADVDVDHARLSAAGLAGSPVQDAARTVRLAAGEATARFRWIAVRDTLWPDVLIAIVEHRTPELVFAPELVVHPNGARRLLSVSASAAAPDLSAFASEADVGGAGILMSAPVATMLPLPGLVLQATAAAAEQACDSLWIRFTG